MSDKVDVRVRLSPGSKDALVLFVTFSLSANQVVDLYGMEVTFGSGANRFGNVRILNVFEGYPNPTNDIDIARASSNSEGVLSLRNDVKAITYYAASVKIPLVAYEDIWVELPRMSANNGVVMAPRINFSRRVGARAQGFCA
jgi:hypothetical protein